MEEQKKVRCAIYTRKSTDEGLDKEFNTLEAQRETGANYILSQKHRGWYCWMNAMMTEVLAVVISIVRL